MLVVALLVVYFESKMRDQNHKIASMLSLVSTLAEDMNGVKMGLNHLAMTSVGGGMPPHFQQPLEQNNSIPFSLNEENKLIAVSDDEDDDDDDDDDSENNESEFDYEESDDESDEDSDDEPVKNIKILTLNINNDNNDNDINDIDESENLDLESMGDFEPKDELLEVSNEYAEEMLSLHYDEQEQEQEEKDEMLDLQHDEQEESNITSSDFKTININLEESHSENVDFKKLSLSKLRSIVSEKNLVGDSSKLKKNELLKLLGIE